MLKFTYVIFRKIYYLIKRKFRLFFKFVYPNLINYLRYKNDVDQTSEFVQLTLCRGRGKVTIGKNCVFGCKTGGFYRGGSIELYTRSEMAQIKIGNNVWTNNNVFISSINCVEISDETLIGQNVIISDHDAHGIRPNERRNTGVIGEVKIGKNCWIGSNVNILKNTIIGDNTIVATGAVVSGTFPSNVIIGGVPAKVIKEI